MYLAQSAIQFDQGSVSDSHFYYGVRSGRTRGVFDNWCDCEDSVKGYSRNEYRKFDSYHEAIMYVNNEDCYDSDESAYYDDLVGDVFVDGCCFYNGRPNARAGVGVYWGPDSPYNISRRLSGRQTNQCAEIEAARVAIVQAKQQGLLKLHLYTDSKFFLQCMEEHIHKWKANGWLNAKGLPVVHKDQFQDLEHEMRSINVEIIHIPAHSGIHGNEAADKLAKMGANKP